jgi:hypothetical protein
VRALPLLGAGKLLLVFQVREIVSRGFLAFACLVAALALVLCDQRGALGLAMQLVGAMLQRLLLLPLFREQRLVPADALDERLALGRRLVCGSELPGRRVELRGFELQLLLQAADGFPGLLVLFDPGLELGQGLLAPADVGLDPLLFVGVLLHLGQCLPGGVPVGYRLCRFLLQRCELGPPGLQRIVLPVFRPDRVEEIHVLLPARARARGLVERVGEPGRVLEGGGRRALALLGEQSLPERQVDRLVEDLLDALVGFAAGQLLLLRREDIEGRRGRLVVGLGIHEVVVAALYLCFDTAAHVLADRHDDPDGLLLRRIEFADEDQERLDDGGLADLVRPLDQRDAVREVDLAGLDAAPVLELDPDQAHQRPSCRLNR